ncbi:MAG: hypothetical protein GKS07_05945 [Nitrosopumilus sp.]|nr:MAG: hypothetical protein GKS07_05945 [Nitrosopumilus sp.]
MTTRQNLTLYDEESLITAIQKFEKDDDLPNFTSAVTKLLKIICREKGLLEVQKP